jgi:hypothetical protein
MAQARNSIPMPNGKMPTNIKRTSQTNQSSIYCSYRHGRVNAKCCPITTLLAITRNPTKTPANGKNPAIFLTQLAFKV